MDVIELLQLCELNQYLLNDIGVRKVDKFEYQAKLEEINKLVEKQEYEEAARIADTIEWKRVRSVRTLCMVSEIYEAIGRVEDSKAILYRAYRRSPNSRQILYRLTEACVQTQDFDDAVEYYTEYVNLAPNDNSKYILKYEIYKGRGSSVEEQIEVLEEYKSKEYTEKWAYELAKLYDEAGMADHCVAECDDLALWFHNGRYVVQALELKQKYVPLTPEQQTIYDNPSEIVDMETKEQVVEKAVPTLDQEITKELPSSEKDVIADSIIMNTEKEIAAAVTEHKEEVLQAEAPVRRSKTKSFDTVGLQNELANSMREILAGLKPAPKVEELEHISGMDFSPEETALRREEIPSEETEKPEVQKTEVQKPAAEESVMTAATINITDALRKEIGNRNLREYAASVKNAEAQSEERKVVVDEIPEVPKMARMPEMVQMPVRTEEPVKKTEPVPVKEEEMIPAAEPIREKTEEILDEPDTEEPANEIPTEAVTDTRAAEPVKTPETAPGPQAVPVDPQSYTRNGLDEKEKSMMGFWSLIRGMNEQIDAAVTQVMRSVLTDKTSASGNVLLVGDAGNGRTTLALGLAKVISRCKGLQTVKVAKIYAEDLNKKDIAATVNKIAGGVLIIEEAGDLDDNTIAQLSMAMGFKTDSLVVVLEDERRYLQDLLARNPQFSQKFTITLNVPTLTNDELVEFGKYYAMENDCVLDDTAALALYDGIGAMQSPEQPVSILDVKEMVDKAMKHASKFSIRKLFSTISGKRYDDQDRIIVIGKNFKKIK